MVVERLQRDAPGGAAVHEREHQPAPRRGICARQIAELLFEALKAQVEMQRPAIFGEKPPDFFDFRARVDVREFHHAYTLLRYSF